VIGHWSTPAPELKLLPAKLFPVIHDVIATRVLSPGAHHKIVQHSEGLHKLFKHAKPNLDAQTQELPSNFLDLLGVILLKAQAALKGESHVHTVFYKSELQPMEEMLTTGTFGPDHPAFQRLPFFKYDYECKRDCAYDAKVRDRERKQHQAEMDAQSMRMGATCKKYKTKKTSLSSGVFTIFCNRCGVCEYFELMCSPESPATPGKALFHRVWRKADMDAWQAWMQSGDN
jgi:hypothetical protein